MQLPVAGANGEKPVQAKKEEVKEKPEYAKKAPVT